MAKIESKESVEKNLDLVSDLNIQLSSARNIQLVLVIITIVVVIFAGVAVYYIYSLNNELNGKYDRLNSQYQELLTNPDKAAQEEVSQLVNTVANLITVPSDETPTVATVQNKDALKDQEFFVNAMNGDKVIIYAKAKKAILFRPSTNKIIEVAPLVIDTQTTDSSAITSDTPTDNL